MLANLSVQFPAFLGVSASGISQTLFPLPPPLGDRSNIKGMAELPSAKADPLPFAGTLQPHTGREPDISDNPVGPGEYVSFVAHFSHKNNPSHYLFTIYVATLFQHVCIFYSSLCSMVVYYTCLPTFPCHLLWLPMLGPPPVQSTIHPIHPRQHPDHRTHMYIQLDHKRCPNAPHCPLIRLVLVGPLLTCTNTPRSTLKHKCTRVLANTAPGIPQKAISILQKGATHPVVPLARAFVIPTPRCAKPARPCPVRPTLSNRTWIWGRHRGITVRVLNRLGFKR